MSRFFCALALSAVGLFSFAVAAQAADVSTPNPQHATSNANGHHDAAAMRPWRASETLGVKVENPQEENLGKIEDLVFNPANGHIRYAVLSFGGVLGIGDKYFAIPWSHFRSEERAGRSGSERFVLVLDVDKNKLKNAPGFDSKNWPDFGDAAYGTSVDQYYGRGHHNHSSSANHSTETGSK